jgi:hypothetical protein
MNAVQTTPAIHARGRLQRLTTSTPPGVFADRLEGNAFPSASASKGDSGLAGLVAADIDAIVLERLGWAC